MLQFEKITSAQAMYPLEEQWNRLLATLHNQNPFIEWGWILTWWLCLGSTAQVEIFVVWQEQVLVGIVPFQRLSQGNTVYYEFIAPHEATMMDIVTTENHADIIAQLMPLLAASSTNTVLRLNGIPDESPTKNALLYYCYKQQLPFHHFTTLTSSLALNELDTDGFIAKRSKNLKIKRMETKLGQAGHYRYEKMTTAQLEQAFLLYNKRWDKKMNTSHFATAHTAPFYEAILQQQQHGRGELHGLFLDDLLLGFTFNYVCRQTITSYTYCFEEDFYKFGIGHLLYKQLFQYSKAHNLQTLDLSIGYEQSKFSWVTESSELHNFVIGYGETQRIVARHRVQALATAMAKSSYKIVQFKRNTVGRWKYYITNPLALCKHFVTSVRRSSETVYQRDFDKKIRPVALEPISLQQALQRVSKDKLISYIYTGFQLYVCPDGDLYAIQTKKGKRPTWQHELKLPIHTEFIEPLQPRFHNLAKLTKKNIQIAVPSYRKDIEQQLSMQHFYAVKKVVQWQFFSKTYVRVKDVTITEVTFPHDLKGQSNDH